MNGPSIESIARLISKLDGGFVLIEASDNESLDNVVFDLIEKAQEIHIRVITIDFLLINPGESVAAFVKREVKNAFQKLINEKIETERIKEENLGFSRTAFVNQKVKNNLRKIEHSEWFLHCSFLLRGLEEYASEHPKDFLMQINFARESLYHLNHTLIFVMKTDFADLFRRYAPDLYSWIYYTHAFQDYHKDDRIQNEIALILPLHFSNSTELINAKEKALLDNLIALYREQRTYFANDPELRINNVIRPLADLYRAINDHKKEMPLRLKIAEFYNTAGSYDHADALADLAWAHCNSSSLERSSHLHRAIHYFRLALKVFTQARHPHKFVQTLYKLGVTWQAFGLNHQEQNKDTENVNRYLRKAISAYKKVVRSDLNAFKNQDALAMNNLGAAYQALPCDDHNKNLKQAQNYYHKALQFITPEDEPLIHATIMYNLGLLYQQIVEGEQDFSSLKAIRCLQEAGRVFNAKYDPRKYAEIMNNIGMLYVEIETYDTKARQANLQNAVKAYQEALKICDIKDYTDISESIEYNLSLAQQEQNFILGDRHALHESV